MNLHVGTFLYKFLFKLNYSNIFIYLISYYVLQTHNSLIVIHILFDVSNTQILTEIMHK